MQQQNHGHLLNINILAVINYTSIATAIQTHTHTCTHRQVNGKKDEYLYSAIYTVHSLKALRHVSHNFTCKLHHACLSFISVHLMAPPLTEVADIQLQLTTHL